MVALVTELLLGALKISNFTDVMGGLVLRVDDFLPLPCSIGRRACASGQR
jgi:hypothetical protein